jgi:hypothetical protein
LLPDYNLPQKQATVIPNPVAVHATGGSVKALESISQVIVEAINDPTVDITRILPMYRENLGNYKNEYLLGTRFTVNNEEKDVLMACVNLIGDDVYALGPLGTDSTWNKLGFSYFDVDGMNALKGFASINLVDKPEAAWKIIKTMFTESKGEQKKLQPIRPPQKPMKGGIPPAGMKPVKPVKPVGA